MDRPTPTDYPSGSLALAFYIMHKKNKTKDKQSNMQATILSTHMSSTPTQPLVALSVIDELFQPLGCLGHGAFGSVFLAEKKSSGRRVALKCIPLADDDDDTFQRELQAVIKLTTNQEKDDREQAIVFFREWFVGAKFACIVMNFADGGTLAQEIAARKEPYTERRIAWYALQLTEALAYAHECGVAHHDVKSANILIDYSGGGKLLLADFGSSVAPREESVGFTKSYAAPELMLAHDREDYEGLRADKIDAFGLGCIIFELLACKKLEELNNGDQTLARFILESGVDAAIGLPCVRLPWLSPDSESDVVGYSQALGSLVKTLLIPDPTHRWVPSQLQESLRNDPLSPLIANIVVAAQPPCFGAAVTVDNVQLGMLVQRGRDWDDDDSNGGEGSIGAVVRLDPDAGYTWVAWPHSSSLEEPACFRIGAGNKFELLLGPTNLPDFVFGTESERQSGLCSDQETSNYHVGQKINDERCVVVAIKQGAVVFAPFQKQVSMFTLPVTAIEPPSLSFVGPRSTQATPSWWDYTGLLVEVTDLGERGDIIENFYDPVGGMDIQEHAITSIKRFQSADKWMTYSSKREEIAAENWGIANEQVLFFGTGVLDPEALVQSAGADFYESLVSSGTAQGLDYSPMFFQKSSYADRHCYKNGSDRQVILAHVVLGRVSEKKSNEQAPLCARCPNKCHSEKAPKKFFHTIHESSQAFPQYVITYTMLQLSQRRTVRAR